MPDATPNLMEAESGEVFGVGDRKCDKSVCRTRAQIWREPRGGGFE